jgi:hypothetical protein
MFLFVEKKDPSGIYGLVQRYQFLDRWPCSTDELDSFGAFLSIHTLCIFCE